jgi:poly(3-hydroxybutyrate) depolymerase
MWRAAVLVLHGSDSKAEDMFDVGFEPLADLYGFLVVYPEMAIPGDVTWNYTYDIPYFTALVQQLQMSPYNIQPDSFFVCGHSSGGTMSTFLQNQVDLFAGAGSVEAAVGHTDVWDMSRQGHRMMIVWNTADPVLQEYAPQGNVSAYLDLTVSTLRRGGTKAPKLITELPLGANVSQAQVLVFEGEDSIPELRIVRFTSNPGQHTWPRATWTNGVDAAEQLVNFFLLETEGYGAASLESYTMTTTVCVFLLAAFFTFVTLATLLGRLRQNSKEYQMPLLAA